MVKFDLALKVVRSDQKAYVVHAGRARRNFSQFHEESAAFLEIPGLSLTDVNLKIRFQIRQAIRRWIAVSRYLDDPESHNKPSSLLKNYPKEVFKEAYFTKLAGSIAALYGKAKVGDIIITPGFETVEGYKTAVVLFGEITSDFVAENSTNCGGKFSQGLPYRAIKWKNVVRRKNISPAVDAHISRPPAVREIKIGEKTEEILGFTYENYVFESSSASKIEARKYDASKFPDFVDVNGLIAFFIAAYTAIEANKMREIRIDEINAFTREYFHQTGIENIKLDFASPGFWRIVGGGAVLATFVSLSLAAFSGQTDLSKADIGIEITNSVASPTEDDRKMQESINILFRSLDIKQKKEIQERVKRAESTIGLKSSVKIADE